MGARGGLEEVRLGPRRGGRVDEGGRLGPRGDCNGWGWEGRGWSEGKVWEGHEGVEEGGCIQILNFLGD